MIKSIHFEDLKEEYKEFFDTCVIDPEYKDTIQYYITRFKKYKERYIITGHSLGIPWYFIGILHSLECGFNFTTHFHNGDPLTGRTVHVPVGRPKHPPMQDGSYRWEDSAIDALTGKNFHKNEDWSTANQLYMFERFNGFGYRLYQDMATPYLWSFSNHYVKGKYGSDRKYDPELVSKQPGAVVLLLSLMENKLIDSVNSIVVENTKKEEEKYR